MLLAAEALAEEKRRIAEKKAAAEKAREERKRTVARERYLAGLAQQEDQVWKKIDDLIATKQPARYDEAVQLLVDLRDVAVQQGRTDHFQKRSLQLCQQHANKPSLLRRMKQAGLGTSAAESL